MPLDQAVFLRIDTSSGLSLLSESAGELVTSALIDAHRTGWFDLLGFCVLPKELQLLIVPRGKAPSEVLGCLEAVLDTKLEGIQKIFDPDYYREKVDCDEEIRQRLRWMHQAPVRSRLVTLMEAYPYSSANKRYQSVLNVAPTLL